MKRKIFLSFGGNLGDVKDTFEQALAHLAANGVNMTKRSSCAVTTPLDCPHGTPDFFNMAIEAETEMTPFELLDLTQSTEVRFGRPSEHGFHESRTLDIDIIWMQDVRLFTKRLTLPHPRAAERDFVMRFLLELDPEADKKVRPVKMLFPCPAPLEGVMTAPLIKTAAEEGASSVFLTPFLRISEHVPKEKEIRKFLAPYKDTDVTLQLMGNSPSLLAAAAQKAAKFDIFGINLNFGCPSGQVLRHKSGGFMLKEPLLMRKICRSIREVCPELPLSVKMRTGFDDAYEFERWLPDWSMSRDDAPDYFILHSRSVKELYGRISEDEHVKRSSAFIKIVRQPVMLNGDINDVSTAVERMNICGGASFMTGRGWLKDPYLFRNFEKRIFEETSFEEKVRFYHKVLENAEKSGTPYPKGKQIELSQLMFAPDNPFMDDLLKK